MSDNLLSVSSVIYRLLLKAYPREFREKFGPDMEQVFRDRCREERLQRGGFGLTKFWIRTLFDLSVTAPAEHLDRLAQDVRYGGRVLLESPAFTTMAVIALALGIGANSAIFSVIRAAMLPLPYQEPDRLVLLAEFGGVSPALFEAWRARNHVFEQMAASSWEGVHLTGGEKPEYVMAARVSTNFFPLLGVKAYLGRIFLQEDDKAVRAHVAVISYDLWHRRYHSDRNLLGKSMTLNGASFNVVGVMPKDFHHPMNESIDLWIPITLDGLDSQKRTERKIHVIARLKPGVTLEAARSDIGAISQPFQPLLGFSTSREIVHPLSKYDQHFLRYTGPILFILQVSVALMLLLACANVAGLLLARAVTRQKEMGIRAALGASRPRLIRQLLTESMLLALVGGVLGLLLAWGITRLMASAFSAGNEFFWFTFGVKEIGVDEHLLGFTLLITLLTGLVFGLTPAILGSRSNVKESLQEGKWKWLPVLQRQHIHSILVVVEVAVALVLVTRAVLETREVFWKNEFRPGLNPSQVLIMETRLPTNRYQQKDQILSAYRKILSRVETLPGVKSVGLNGSTPWFDSAIFMYTTGVATETSSSGPAKGVTASYAAINPDFLRAMRIPLRTGRYFTDQLSGQNIPTAIIDQGLAEYLFPKENPVGKRIRIVNLPEELSFLPPAPRMMDERNQRIAELPGAWYSVVGVAENRVGEPLNQGIYIPYDQAPESSAYPMRFLSLVVRAHSDPIKLVTPITHAIWSVDKDIPVLRTRTVEQYLKGWTAPGLIFQQLFGIFTAAAMVLAAVGIYGLMTYVASQRAREIGIRLSLGARPSQVLRLVMWQGLKLIAIGVFLGLILAFTLPVFLPMLYQILTLNPETFSGDLAPHRVMILLLGMLIGAVVVLAAAGVYTFYHESSADSREVSAIGRAGRAVKWLVGRASKLTLTGIMAGLLLTSLGFGIFVSLEGAQMTHPPSFIAASFLLAAVALLACYLSARKAIRIDPIEALQAE